MMKLALLLAGLSSAQGFVTPRSFRDLVADMRSRAQHARDQKRAACAPRPGPDGDAAKACEGVVEFGWRLCPEGEILRLPDAGPINAGFAALGPAGKTGKIDGPGRQGNGTYRVDKNEPLELSVFVNTGYIRAQVTLTRDPQTGKDRARFTGKFWDNRNGRWGPDVDDSSDAVVSFDRKGDSGKLQWNDKGTWKEERYWGGKSGKSMTIEFGGGYDHDFAQD